jgi:hypothetical protein
MRKLGRLDINKVMVRDNKKRDWAFSHTTTSKSNLTENTILVSDAWSQYVQMVPFTLTYLQFGL